MYIANGPRCLESETDSLLGEGGEEEAEEDLRRIHIQIDRVLPRQDHQCVQYPSDLWLMYMYL